MAHTEEASPTFAGTEQRMVRRVEIYWRRISRGRAMPTMNDVNPDRLPVPWKACFILSLGTNGTDGLFDHAGSEIARDCGTDLTGEMLADVPAKTLTATALAGLTHMRETCDAVIMEGTLQHRDGGQRLYRTILLPFGRQSDGVDTVIGALSWCDATKR